MKRKYTIFFNILIILFLLWFWYFIVIPHNYSMGCLYYNESNNLFTSEVTAYKSPYNVSLVDVGNPYNWTNLENTKDQDDIYASCNFPSSGYSNYILATNFSFNLLPYYIIEGIYLEINQYTMDYIYWYDIHLWFDGGIVGDQFYGGWIPSIDDDSYDVPTLDTGDWNAGLTYDQINNETFGFYFKYREWYGFPTTAYIDHIRVYIEYSLPGPPTYENLKVYYNPLIVGYNEIFQLDVYGDNPIINVTLEIENVNYSFINIYNDTYYYDKWHSNITGIKEYRIYMIDYYNLTTIKYGQIAVFNPDSLVLNVLGFIFLFILIAMMLLCYYKFRTFLFALIIELFSLVFGVMALELELPLQPFIPLFFLIFQSGVFAKISFDFYEQIKR